MQIHAEDRFADCFGDATTSVAYADFGPADQAGSVLLRPFVQALGAESGAMLKQVHGTDGCVIHSADHARALGVRQHKGDFLVTAVPGVVLCVATADCLPIIFYDRMRQACGIAHAGWRGSVADITGATLASMQTNFGTEPGDLQILFGPSARSCCYRVQEDFMQNFKPFSFADQLFHREDQELFFDLPLFNRLQLEKHGVASATIDERRNICTICNPAFCSVRREGQQTGRQITAVALCGDLKPKRC